MTIKESSLDKAFKLLNLERFETSELRKIILCMCMFA